MIGSMVAHYRVTGKIGEGGMGVVYKAEDTRLERTVALKFLSSAVVPDSGRQRFWQEARSAARVQHPNICSIFEINEDAGRPFFAMAFVEGKTISQWLETGALPLSKVLDIGMQIASGLEAAHQLGIVHRDIKSGNIVVGEDGHATILDFGLALAVNAERLTMPGVASGTIAYMSPEQAQGTAVDHRTDIWSLGVVLFEMLSGALPFQRDSIFGIMNAIVNQDATAIRALRPQLPGSMEALLKTALAKDPIQRFQSAAALGAALRRIRDTQSQQAETVTSFETPIQPQPFPLESFRLRRRWKWAAAGGALLLVMAAAAFFVFHKPIPEQKHIAVLPFEIIGDQNDPAIRALADGLVETLTAKLSQVEDFQGKLMVIPASEIRSRKISTVEEARRIYGANLAITGSAQRWADKIQFNEVLEDTASVRQLGSISFELVTERATDIRDRAIDGAMHLLHVKLVPATVTALEAGETAAPGAYSDYLKGVGYLARFDVVGNVDRAIGSLQNAISADPKYALAFAALGEAHWAKAKLTSDPQEAASALTNIKRALELDGRLIAAHIKLGEVYSESGQPELAINEERSALHLAPCSAQAYHALGTAYTATSRFGEAEEAYQKGISCEPTDWYGYSQLGYFYVQRGRLKDARTAYETARALTPDNEIVFRNLAALDMREGKFQDAISLSLKTFKSDPRTFAILGLAYYYQHQYQEAATALNASLQLAPEVYQNWGNLGTVYRHLPGSEEKARQAFLKAINLAKKLLEVEQGDFRAHANLAEYYAKLGDSRQAINEVNQIPETARGPFIDRIVLAYQFAGDRKKATEIAHSIPENNPVIHSMKNDPDLAGLWSNADVP